MSNEFIGDTPFPPPPRASAFQWGLIGAGILVGIEIVWYVLGNFLLYSIIGFWITSPFYFNCVLICLPILAALPVFFWISKQATSRTGLARAGINAVFQAGGWWVIFKIFLSIVDLLLFGFRINPFWDGVVFILAILLMFGAAWLMGAIGEKSSGSQGTLQLGYFPPPQVSRSDAPFGVSPSPTPQAYQPPPQPQSALEILQLRFARGEIDPVTYQEMRAQLEASSHPNPNPR